MTLSTLKFRIHLQADIRRQPPTQHRPDSFINSSRSSERRLATKRKKRKIIITVLRLEDFSNIFRAIAFSQVGKWIGNDFFIFTRRWLSRACCPRPQWRERGRSLAFRSPLSRAVKTILFTRFRFLLFLFARKTKKRYTNGTYKILNFYSLLR